jgi:hypothetical protein
MSVETSITIVIPFQMLFIFETVERWGAKVGGFQLRIDAECRKENGLD